MPDTSMFWRNKKVLVTGGAGFIGSHLVQSLLDREATVRVVDSLENGSLENLSPSKGAMEHVQADLGNLDNCLAACAGMDAVMGLAAKVAGVAYNSSHPAEMFRANTKIGLNLLEATRKLDVERTLVVSSACVYRRNSTVPTPESEGFIDDPEPSNLGYGWAKRVLELQARMYSEEYGAKIAIVRPFNTYGPRDHFDPEYGHVIPSLIKKATEGQDPIIVWGDGTQTRSFIYVTDVVEGMLLALEKYAVADPVNIGTEEEVTVDSLARQIVDLAGTRAGLQFDITRPSGQPRRAPDVTKAREKLGFESKIRLHDGLKRTIDWYVSRRPTITA
jgi:GDP-L-fucose synthase